MEEGEFGQLSFVGNSGCYAYCHNFIFQMLMSLKIWAIQSDGAGIMQEFSLDPLPKTLLCVIPLSDLTFHSPFSDHDK